MIENDVFDLRSQIRTIPDYPKPGIKFRDITTLLAMPAHSAARWTICEPLGGSRSTRWRASRRAASWVVVAHQVSRASPIRKKEKLLSRRCRSLFARIRHRRNGDAQGCIGGAARLLMT
jgi:adenine phosphoribosyltransferase